MMITIARSANNEKQAYTITLESATLLTIFNHIKSKIDPTLTYSHSCRSGVCGSCAVRVNGTEVLACEYKPADGDIVEPMRNIRVVRDLVVDVCDVGRFNAVAHTWSEGSDVGRVSANEMELIERSSDCILCQACMSACPVYTLNPDFIGPFALTRAWRYVSDAREEQCIDKISAVQVNGIWDCTLCGECVPVCPKDIAPAQEIRMLRSKSGVMGYVDPSMSKMFDGGLDFGSFTS